MKLILASASPRRAEIMRSAGFVFEICAADVDEARKGGEAPADYVRRLADAKARTAARKIAGNQVADTTVVIGADTVVVLEGEILGKPVGEAEARTMLRRLSGRSHEVHTGMALLRLPDGAARVLEEVTLVDFASMTTSEIDDYVATGEPSGKAGAYAVQGRGGRFVRRISGSYFNVMGLPVARLYEELLAMGIEADALSPNAVKDTYTLWSERPGNL
jgi:septum formation protein